MSAAADTPRFGTFTGVFTPMLLAILGVILYVRMGWVVGNAGLGGAMLILGLGILLTTCTGLALSSIATNTRIGHGGPDAILNKSLGLEVGGSVGIPVFAVFFPATTGILAGANMSGERDIHLWVRRGRQGWDAHEAFESGNLNLILLLGYRLWRVWRGSLTLLTVVDAPADEPAALGFLHALCDLVRFPTSGRRAVRFGDIAAVEPADLSLFGLQRDAPDLAWAEHCTGLARGSALFVLDSGRESARA